jgi:osmotically-inducible protein OsmY
VATRPASDSLRWNTLVPHELISVSATHGRITLRGEIPHQYRRQAAENAVRYLVGVKSLNNEITVTPPVVPGDVIGLIEKALVRNAEADARNIQVAADGGKVTLSGKVHSWAERAEVARAAWKAPGVHEVLNDLVVDA